MSVLDIATGGQSIAAKLGVYALAAIVLLGIGGGLGYKLGTIMQKDADKTTIDDLTARLNKATMADVKESKAGQDALTGGISEAKDKEAGSKDARDAIIDTLPDVKLPKIQPQPQTTVIADKGKLPVPGASSLSKQPEPQQSVANCGCTVSFDSAAVVNQLLEKSNETGFYLSDNTDAPSLRDDSIQTVGLDRSATLDEVNINPEVAASPVRLATDHGESILLGEGDGDFPEFVDNNT